MFPLGTVLLPGGGLPLHVFEPRYLALVADCLGGDGSFGVVLIERGHEVGGGDVRTDFGTLARIVEAVELPDGRWAIGAIGEQRIRVRRWLHDDPYPRADVDAWPDPAPGTEHSASLAATTAVVRRALARLSELGRPVPPSTFELSDDAVRAGYELLVLAPISLLDRHRLLGAASPDERIAALGPLVEERMELYEAGLGQ